MEREVLLSRTGEEPWGFRLIGGADFNMPLTVVKVLPDSPAELACLRNGDTVSRIAGADAGPMTHDEAKAAVAAATDTLNLGVMRGLYDPVLDDYDPIYEPIDQDDFDQPSHPTEVFQIRQFTETPLDDNLSRSRTGSCANPDVRGLSELRSTNESPFVLSTKPYRPFSTEPTPVPPLEDPIILNPDYHDEFAKVVDVLPNEFDKDDGLLKGLEGLDEILGEKARFKLPISEQYDPDGTKTKKSQELMSITTVEKKVIKEETITQVTKEVKTTLVEERLAKEQKEDVKFMEKMKKEIDLDKIEMTASSIVDESIAKAITVADEIKKEIDLELTGITSESKFSSTDMVESVTTKKDFAQEVNKLVAMTDKTTDAHIKKSDVSVAKEVAKFETDDKQIIIDERKEFMKQELEETIESGSVRRKSEMYDKEVKTADIKIEKKSIDDIETGIVRKKTEMYDKEVKMAEAKVEKMSIDDIETGSVKKRTEMYDKEVITADVKVEKKCIDDKKIEKKQSKRLTDQTEIREAQSIKKKQTEIKSESVSQTIENTQKSEENKSKEAKYTTAKLLAEQRAYTIGLQTIPHIRGTVQSSYHYDLLLKTFFIHLTDVMVALSRFILAEPILSQPLETKPEVKKEVATETVVKESQVDKRFETIEKEDKQIRKQKTQKVVDTVKEDHVTDSRWQEYIDYAENIQVDDKSRIEKKMLSGAEMSQLSEKKSGDLINKMDGVITEFQTKAGLEEEIIMQRERRSRSRSRLEDAQKESDSLELISKVDKKTQDITEIKTSSVSESMEMRTETRQESEEIKRESKQETRDIQIKDGKNTYIAIVQAHVYTNKNLLDEIAEISEATTVENIEKTNIALEANEAMITERVAVESQKKEEIAEIVESHELGSAKTEEVVVQEKKYIAQEIDVSFVEVESKKEVAEVQVMETVQPIVELHEDIVEKSVSVEIKHGMDIQEIQTTEYTEKLDVVKEEFVDTAQDVQEIKEVQDVQISEEVKTVEISAQVSAKVEEDISIIKEEVESSLRTEEAFIQEKKDFIEEIDVQKSFIEVESKKEVAEVQVIETVEPIVELQEEIVLIKEEAVAVQDVKIEEVIEDIKVAEEITVVKESTEVSDKSIEAKDEYAQLKAIKEEITEKGEDIKISQDIDVNIKKSTEISDKSIEIKDEYAQLKVPKEQITEIDESIEIDQEIEVNIKKSVHIAESENTYQSFISESSVLSSEIAQESTFIAMSKEEAKKSLTLDLDSQIKKSDSQTSFKSTISTPTPSTVPPTPLTDEYVFRLEIPLPKITGPPIPRSPSPEDEDPHIVKKNLVPHIDTEIVEEVVYETPLPSPPEDKTSPPKFTKPGLKGGNIRYIINKEEIKEIERKSSLLASAIDQTIKSIEEYKEEVGIDTKTENPVVYNGYTKVIDNKVYKEKHDEVNIEKQIIQNTDNINKFVQNRAATEDTVSKVTLNGKAATVTVVVENNMANSVSEGKMYDSVETVCLEGYRPVLFHPEDAPHIQRVTEVIIPEPTPTVDPGKAFVTANGEILGTHQGIVDGLEEAVVYDELAKELGKPGMTEQKIAELISGESEMLREAHVMGLTRVLKSHMHRDDDDSSVDFKKIKPIVESLKDSEVLKALNEEFTKTQEEKKKEERKWTKFLQKPARPVPKAKFGSKGWTAEEEEIESPYKVKIVKQPKPKVAPDYKPQDFNTGPLPWEERALNEPPPPPLEAEAPILVPEECPQFLEALDTLPESAVPDLEETGIPLPPEEPTKEPTPEPEPEPEEQKEKEVEEPKQEEPAQVTSSSDQDMENRVAEQLIKNVEGMVDPNAPLEQQLAQMRAQLAALAQLPGVIQQTLEIVTRQLCQITQQESQSHQTVTQSQMALESSEMLEEANETSETVIEDVTEESKEETQIVEVAENEVEAKEEKQDVKEAKKEVPRVSDEEMEKMKREEEEILGEQRRIEKQKKEIEAETLEQESDERPETPHEIALRFINIEGWNKVWPWGDTQRGIRKYRVNFMKYEKPPITLDHLQNSDVYKMIHDMEQKPLRQVELLTPVIAEADYREKCRSMTPCAERIG